MSEIFDGLKRAEMERKKMPLVAETQVAPSGGHPLEMRTLDLGKRETEMQPYTAKFPLSRESVFDLNAADARLKNILDPHSIVGEQYRMLRAKLSLMRKQVGVKSILISSTVQNEGKTLVSCGLAAVLAQEPGKRVLLIDADLRKPDAYKNLGLIGEDRFDGFSQVLRGEVRLEDAVLKSAESEFYFLPAGPVPPDPAELLSSHHLELALKSAAKFFDWIVIDSPPILPLADTTILAPLCDTTLLIVHANATPSKLIKSAIQTLGRDRFCGIVLNRVPDLMSSTYYYYYHHNHNLRLKKQKK